MDYKTLLYRAKSWLRHQLTAWNTGGEGVHSPYLFEWVRMVMTDKNEYYTWEDIEMRRQVMLQDRRELEFVDYGSAKKSQGLENGNEAAYRLELRDIRRVCDIARGSLAKRKYAQMLYRLVHWLGHQLREDGRGLEIVELGTSLGITTAYLAAADKRDNVKTYEGCAAVASVAQENWQKLGLDNILCCVGEIDIEKLKKDVASLDVAFIDANHTYANTLEYFGVLADKAHEKSIIVVDDIHYSEEMEKAWKAICADVRVTSTIDLYQMGLVFFDKRYWRRNYRMRL